MLIKVFSKASLPPSFCKCSQRWFRGTASKAFKNCRMNDSDGAMLDKSMLESLFNAGLNALLEHSSRQAHTLYAAHTQELTSFRCCNVSNSPVQSYTFLRDTKPCTTCDAGNAAAQTASMNLPSGSHCTILNTDMHAYCDVLRSEHLPEYVRISFCKFNQLCTGQFITPTMFSSQHFSVFFVCKSFEVFISTTRKATIRFVAQFMNGTVTTEQCRACKDSAGCRLYCA